MALDSGIHAGMTAFFGSAGLVYNDERWSVGTRENLMTGWVVGCMQWLDRRTKYLKCGG